MPMWKSCGRCGRVHAVGYKCTALKPLPKTRTEDQRLRSTSRWQKKAEEIKKASNYLCTLCKLEGKLVYDNIEVHHIIKLKDDTSRLLDNYNLICLCKYHHELADAGKIKASYLEELARSREEGKYPPTQQG